MELHVRQMGLRDVDYCVELVAAHSEEQLRYGRQLKNLPAAWRKLIRSGSLNSSVVEYTGGGQA